MKPTDVEFWAARTDGIDRIKIEKAGYSKMDEKQDKQSQQEKQESHDLNHVS